MKTLELFCVTHNPSEGRSPTKEGRMSTLCFVQERKRSHGEGSTPATTGWGESRTRVPRQLTALAD